MTYTYRDPRQDGFVKTSITLRQLYKAGLSHSGKGIVKYAEVYYNEEKGFILEYYNRLWVKILTILLYPISLILSGVVNFKEVNRETKRVLFQKKYGAFSSDRAYPNEKITQKLIDLMLK